MVTRASFTWSSSSNPANVRKPHDRCGKDGGLLRSGSRSGFGYHDHSTPNPNQSCYPDGYSTDTGKGRELETEPLTWDWRDGLWRSLVSALDWGSRGPGFKSRQPDHRRPRSPTWDLHGGVVRPVHSAYWPFA